LGRVEGVWVRLFFILGGEFSTSSTKGKAGSRESVYASQGKRKRRCGGEKKKIAVSKSIT